MKSTLRDATMGMRGTGPHRPAPPAAPARWQRRRHVATVSLLALLLMLTQIGCGPLGWMAHSLAGGKQRVRVPAQYRGLEEQRVAVLIDLDEHTLHQHRQAPLLISQSVSAEIAANVQGARLVNPRDMVDFQHANPYWSMERYGSLIEALDVDRLVIVDVLEFRLHEPGNTHIWQGFATGTVMVVEAGSRDPDQPVLAVSVRAEFPEDAPHGSVKGNAESIRTGLVQSFGLNVARVFHDHEVWR